MSIGAVKGVEVGAGFAVKDMTGSENNDQMQAKDDKVVLIAQDQKLDVRNGAELLVNEGDLIPADESITTFDPVAARQLQKSTALLLIVVHDVIP